MTKQPDSENAATLSGKIDVEEITQLPAADDNPIKTKVNVCK